MMSVFGFLCQSNTYMVRNVLSHFLSTDVHEIGLYGMYSIAAPNTVLPGGISSL
ncbi:MAG: hypothetical protein ACK5C0_00495 [Candidatus Kapaibacterium sp.]